MGSTYEFGIPDSIFYASSGLSPDDSNGLSQCDPSCAWVVSLTVYYNTSSDNWTCISLLSPGYVANWTRYDRSVTVSNAVIGAGLNSYAYCGGVKYGHDQKTVGAPISGQNYNFWPSWGSFNASVNSSPVGQISYYQCGNASATFTRYGSSWNFTTSQLPAGPSKCP